MHARQPVAMGWQGGREGGAPVQCQQQSIGQQGHFSMIVVKVLSCISHDSLSTAVMVRSFLQLDPMGITSHDHCCAMTNG